MPTDTPGFKVSHGPNKNTPDGAMIFEDAKSEKEARRLFKKYMENTHLCPETIRICSVVPLSEITGLPWEK